MTLELTELTTSVVEGTGVFDKLMQATKAHLEQEYAKGRIKGPEYATVYLGALTNVMQNSVTFLLQKDKAGLERDLLAQQILLAQVEVQKAQAELAILEQGLPKITAEIAVLVAQECKLRAEYDLTVKNTEKTTAEIDLLGQKTATERAQTQNIGVDANSVIGKQRALYQAQTDGFARDAEQKAAKLLVDTWSARRMSDEATSANADNKLQDVTIGRVVEKVLTGVGA